MTTAPAAYICQKCEQAGPAETFETVTAPNPAMIPGLSGPYHAGCGGKLAALPAPRRED